MRQLGGYTLTTRLGAGGMGEVWKGRRSALGGSAIDVAIKVLSASTVDDLDARKMFLDEARLSMLLTNSNIIKVFDAAESEDNICYLVMEWVDGLNLAELTAKLRKAGERLPDVIIAFIVGELLKGLAHAHELRHEGRRYTIVHRDVSPQNVMLSVFGEVKIMDFGIARVASEETSGLHVKGKIRYMAPEQLQGKSREPTVDLFAAGAILHELLDGMKFRIQITDEAHLYGTVLGGEIPPMTRAVDTIPKELDELRRGLLAAKPSERIQSAREAFRRLVTWPGYRDARFELDEIVRQYANPVELQPAVLPPTQSVARPSGGTPRVESGPAEVTETDPMPGEVSDTDVSPGGGVGSNLAIPVNSQPVVSRDKRKLWMVFAGLSLVFAVGLAMLNVALFMEDDEEPPAEPVQVAKAEKIEKVEPEPEPVQEKTEEPPPVDLGPPVEKPPIIEKPPEEIETPPPPTEAAKKTKVSFVLGSKVGWAEIKLGSRSVVLDAFESKNSSTSSFAPGKYDASFRTQVGGPWTKAGRIEVSRKSMSITLQKGGQLVVK